MRQNENLNHEKTQIGLQANLNMPFEMAIEQVTSALKAEGFGVLTEIDVKATLKQKLGLDFKRYTILGACNPPLAHQALLAEPDIGLLLPCNVIIYEVEGGTMVSIVDPLSMLGMVDNPALVPVTDEARARLERVHSALSSQN